MHLIVFANEKSCSWVYGSLMQHYVASHYGLYFPAQTWSSKVAGTGPAALPTPLQSNHKVMEAHFSMCKILNLILILNLNLIFVYNIYHWIFWQFSI